MTPVRQDAFGNVTTCADDRKRSSRFIGPVGGCGGELLIIGLNHPQNFLVYLLFNGLGCSPDGIMGVVYAAAQADHAVLRVP